MDTVRKAARGFIRTLRPVDRASVVGFNQAVHTLQDWTGDRGALAEAVATTRPVGGTSLFTAVYVALRSFPPATDGTPRRRAVVVLSDGDDTASLVSFDDVLDEVQRSGVAVYTVVLKKRNDPFEPVRLAARPSEFVMRRLAERSGGRMLAIDTVEDLAGAYAAIATEIANLYLIAFEPAEADGQPFRQVTLRLPHHPGVAVRTRPGYFAGGPTT
jgi:VWFA-related protein